MMRDPFGPAGPARVPRLDDSREYEVLRRASEPAQPRLSVVIPGYDTARYVGAAIRSVLAQTVRDLEVIVVDDGSHDDSVARVLAVDDPRLTLVRQVNRGLAGARNTGILLARAPLIGFCDSDDAWHPLKAALQLAVMEADARVGVTFSFSAYLDDGGAPTGQFLTTRHVVPRVHDLVRRNHLGNGSTAIVRRTCLERVGLYDESLGNVEEWELWVRLAARLPDRFVCIPEALTGYRVRAGSLSVNYESFLANAWIAIQRFRENFPGFTDRGAQRAYAEVLRIASRKSLAAGNIGQSRRFLVEALRRSPTLLLTDVRAFAMACLHLWSAVLPASASGLPYRVTEAVLRRLGGAFRPATVEAWRFAEGLS